MVREHSKHDTMRMHTDFWWGNPKERTTRKTEMAGGYLNGS
jgi:hypothetical protein